MITNGRIAPDFPEGKDYYVDTFSNIVIKNAPKYELFGISELLKNYLDDADMNRYWDLEKNIKAKLLQLDVIEPRGSWQFMINESVRDSILNPKEPEKHNTTNIFANNSNVVYDSYLDNSPIANNVTPIPSKNEPKSILDRIWKFTDHKLIAQILIIIIGLIAAYYGFKILK